MVKIKHEKLGANVNRMMISDDSSVLFSYDTLVAFRCGNTVYEDETNYSRTTNKHKSQYLYRSPKDIIVKMSPQDLQMQVVKHMADLLLNKLEELL